MLIFLGCGPSFTYLPKQVHALKSVRSCSQGPLDIELVALGAQRSEQLEIYACSTHALAGRYVLSQGSWVSQGSYGSEAPDNQRCLAGPLDRAQGAGGPAQEGSVHSADTSVHSAPPPAAPASERLLQEVAWAAPPAWCRETRPDGGASYEWSSGRVCPCGLKQTRIAIMEWSDDVTAPLRAGERLQLRLWSVEPNDLLGAIFLARQLALDPATRQKKWIAARHREDDRRVAGPPRPRQAEAEEPAGPANPPPPPRAEVQPPRPSVHAEWVPGYWHFSDSTWNWICGWWRVPDSDVAGGLTTRAPSAPPALRVEAIPPRGFGGAVWVPGQWHWSGRGWIWVGGAWRLPPGRGLRWRPATWRIGPGGAEFVPGGWVP